MIWFIIDEGLENFVLNFLVIFLSLLGIFMKRYMNNWAVLIIEESVELNKSISIDNQSFYRSNMKNVIKRIEIPIFLVKTSDTYFKKAHKKDIYEQRKKAKSSKKSDNKPHYEKGKSAGNKSGNDEIVRTRGDISENKLTIGDNIRTTEAPLDTAITDRIPEHLLKNILNKKNSDEICEEVEEEQQVSDEDREVDKDNTTNIECEIIAQKHQPEICLICYSKIADTV